MTTMNMQHSISISLYKYYNSSPAPRTNPNFFWAFLHFNCYSLDPIFSNEHALWATKSPKSSVTRNISEADPSFNSDIGYLINIVRMEHSSFKYSE